MLHAALWLIVSLFGVAAIFAILQAGFFAVIQVVVYIGAIAILIIFAIMLTRNVMEDIGSQTSPLWWVAAVTSALVGAGLLGLVLRWGAWSAPIPEFPEASQTPLNLGQALVSPQAFVLPFEVASILLLAALVGAIFIAGNLTALQRK
jgi:NADH-quinone oxidoreductase subunit J